MELSLARVAHPVHLGLLSFGKLSPSRSLAVLVMLILSGGVARAGSPMAKRLLAQAPASRGICVVLGCDDSELLAGLAESGGLFVHGVDSEAADVEKARIRLHDLHGKRVTIETGDYGRLPHADHMVDWVVSASLGREFLQEAPWREVARILRPAGKAVLGWTREARSVPQVTDLEAAARKALDLPCVVKDDDFGVWLSFTKPEPAGVDDWSHWQHGLDNNPVSTDSVIKAPFMTQWLGEPYYIAMPAITTVAGGRTFTAMGHIAHHQREEPWLQTVVARNGYNGVELWRRRLPDGYLVHRSAFIATDDVFYLIADDGNGCLMLDPETGQPTGEIRVPEIQGEWKWMGLRDGVLYFLAGPGRDHPETTRVKSQAGHWGWQNLNRGYYEKRLPYGYGRELGAYHLEERQLLWRHAETMPIDSRAIVMSDSLFFFYGPEVGFGALDAKGGKVRWRNNDRKAIDLVEEAGTKLASTPGFRTTCYSLYGNGVLFYAGQTQQNLVALSAETGQYLWHRSKVFSNANFLFADGALVMGLGARDRENTAMVAPATGQVIRSLGFVKTLCTRMTGTPESLFCRGGEGPSVEGFARYDRASGKTVYDGAMRPGCNDGAIGANGLLYVGPWLCDCNLQLMGTVALCSANGNTAPWRSASKPALEKPGENSQVLPLEVSDNDWPTYRANHHRSSATQVAVPPEAAKRWEYSPATRNLPTPLTAVGGLVFVCGDDGKVRALDAESGKIRWEFLTAGPIMAPPTIWNHRAYVGSGDGYIYALEAATGRQLWRFRAAPDERRIMVYGSLRSTWPVNTGVLVKDGIAYAAAGLVDRDGTFVYALDAISGEVKWSNTTSGRLHDEARKGVSAQGCLTVTQDALCMAGGNVVSPAVYDLKTGRCWNQPPVSGSPQSNRGQEVGLFAGKYLYVGGRLQFSAAANVVNLATYDFFAPRAGEAPQSLGPFIHGHIAPTWLDDMFVYVDGRYGKLCCADLPAAEEFLANLPQLGKQRAAVMDVLRPQAIKELQGLPADASPQAKNEVLQKYVAQYNRRVAQLALKPRISWFAKDLEGKDVISVVLAANAVVAVCTETAPKEDASAWAVYALRRQDGAVLWKQPLLAPPLPGGTIIDRRGQVLVPLENGSITCFANSSSAHVSSNCAQVSSSCARVSRPRTSADRRSPTLISFHPPQHAATSPQPPVKPNTDYSTIRGLNYIASYAPSDVAMWRHYDHAVIDRELGYVAGLGCNSVRVWLAWVVWDVEREKFIEKFKDFLSLCHKHGLTAMPILWDSCFGDARAKYDDVKDWVANPGTERVKDPVFRVEGDAYVRQVVEAGRDSPSLLMWDIMNEPSGEGVNAWLEHYAKLVKSLDPSHPVTIGWAHARSNKISAAWVDVLSYHPYGVFRKNWDVWTAAAREIAAANGNKPILANEVGSPGFCMPYEEVIENAARDKVGFYLFAAMIGTTRFRRVQGYFFDDGTVRDMEAVQAFQQLAREHGVKTLRGYALKKDGPGYIPTIPKTGARDVARIVLDWDQQELTSEKLDYYQNLLTWTFISIAWGGGLEEDMKRAQDLGARADKAKAAGDMEAFKQVLGEQAALAARLLVEKGFVEPKPGN